MTKAPRQKHTTGAVARDAAPKDVRVKAIKPRLSPLANPDFMKLAAEWLFSERIDKPDYICNTTDTMNHKIQDLLQEANIPRELWARASADVLHVLTVLLESGGKRSALRPPSMRGVSELLPETLEKKRIREARSKAAYRAKHPVRPASELTGDDLEKRRKQEREAQARYRDRVRKGLVQPRP